MSLLIQATKQFEAMLLSRDEQSGDQMTSPARQYSLLSPSQPITQTSPHFSSGTDPQPASVAVSQPKSGLETPVSDSLAVKTLRDLDWYRHGPELSITSKNVPHETKAKIQKLTLSAWMTLRAMLFSTLWPLTIDYNMVLKERYIYPGSLRIPQSGTKDGEFNKRLARYFSNVFLFINVTDSKINFQLHEVTNPSRSSSSSEYRRVILDYTYCSYSLHLVSDNIDQHGFMFIVNSGTPRVAINVDAPGNIKPGVLERGIRKSGCIPMSATWIGHASGSEAIRNFSKQWGLKFWVLHLVFCQYDGEWEQRFKEWKASIEHGHNTKSDESNLGHILRTRLIPVDLGLSVADSDLKVMADAPMAARFSQIVQL